MSDLVSRQNYCKKINFIKLRLNKNEPLEVISEVKHVRTNQRIQLTILTDFDDGTQVKIYSRHGGVFIKNNISEIKNGSAEFSNLRIVGRSGRGKFIDLNFKIKARIPRIYEYANAIKVTADGERRPRRQQRNSVDSEESAESGSSGDEPSPASSPDIARGFQFPIVQIPILGVQQYLVYKELFIKFYDYFLSTMGSQNDMPDNQVKDFIANEFVRMMMQKNL